MRFQLATTVRFPTVSRARPAWPLVLLTVAASQCKSFSTIPIPLRKIIKPLNLLRNDNGVIRKELDILQHALSLDHRVIVEGQLDLLTVLDP